MAQVDTEVDLSNDAIPPGCYLVRADFKRKCYVICDDSPYSGKEIRVPLGLLFGEVDLVEIHD